MPRFSLRELIQEFASQSSEQAQFPDPGFFTLDLARARAILDRKLAALEDNTQATQPVPLGIDAACAVLDGTIELSEDVDAAGPDDSQSQSAITLPARGSLATSIVAAFSVFQVPVEGLEEDENN